MQTTRRLTRALAVALVLALTSVAGAARTRLDAAWSGERSCPVTIPNRTVPSGAGFSAAGFNYGNRHLRAHLYWPSGTLRAGTLPDGGSFTTINPNGTIYVKLGWWRGVPGKLAITGRRLDAAAPPLRASASNGYGPRGFQPSGLTFPTVGCWKVVGKVGRATTIFVVKVVKLKQ